MLSIIIDVDVINPPIRWRFNLASEGYHWIETESISWWVKEGKICSKSVTYWESNPNLKDKMEYKKYFIIEGTFNLLFSNCILFCIPIWRRILSIRWEKKESHKWKKMCVAVNLWFCGVVNSSISNSEEILWYYHIFVNFPRKTEICFIKYTILN